ncbi:MAG: lamin tail domain-containing protein [Bacteroidales bacterium]|nr:lamin tail domain-containing protein [Bacteroidales bacterium]
MFAILLSTCVLITELMADPTPSAGLPPYEYVEIWNAAGHPVDLADWTLQCGRSGFTFGPCVMAPRAYLILCSETAAPWLAPFGPVHALWKSATQLTNDGQTVVLRDAGGVLQSSVSYDLTWYHDTRKKTGGWSLEWSADTAQARVAPGPADAAMWRASADPSGGTPGALNSWQVGTAVAQAALQVEPERFSPDGDGVSDEVTVHYVLPEADGRVDLVVFDRYGAPVRRLARDVMALREGTFVWDGCDGRGRTVPSGIYVIWFRTWHPSSGQTAVIRKPVAVSR